MSEIIEDTTESNLEYWTKLSKTLISIACAYEDSKLALKCEKIIKYISDFQTEGVQLPEALTDIYGKDQSDQIYATLNESFSSNPIFFDFLFNFLEVIAQIDCEKLKSVINEIVSKITNNTTKLLELTEIIDKNYQTDTTNYIVEYGQIIKNVGSGSNILTDEELHQYQKAVFTKLQSKRAFTKNMSEDYPILYTILKFIRGEYRTSASEEENKDEKLIPLVKRKLPQIIDYVIVLNNILEVMDQKGNLSDILNQIPKSFIDAYKTLDNFCLIEKSDIRTLADCMVVDEKDKIFETSFPDLINLRSLIDIIQKYSENIQEISIPASITSGIRPNKYKKLRLTRALKYIFHVKYPIVIKKSVLDILKKSQKDKIKIKTVVSIIENNKRKHRENVVVGSLIGLLVIAMIFFVILMIFML